MVTLTSRKYISIGLLCHLFVLISSLNNITQFDGKFNFVIEDEYVSSYKVTQRRDLNSSSRSAYKTIKNKADTLSRLLNIHVDRLKTETDQVELVFLVDASGSVGLKNFHSELNFVKNVLSDFIVAPSAARVAIVTFGGRRNIRQNVDQISRTSENNHKCYLLNKQLNNINYTGGGTYTRGALMEAVRILENGRENAKKAVFLITDGFSNGGDPRPAANLLKVAGATIFTFGIRTGNVMELHDIASSPGYSHSYFLNSFAEFEALARRALHRDLRTGVYVPVKIPDDCDILCKNISEIESERNCCDNIATCSCGIATGHYACICPIGYFGSGLKGSCQPCPNGTYASGEISGDSTSSCISCPDVNHVTIKKPATSVEHCVCASGFITYGNKCEVITCPKLKIPENGYLVKASACNNVVHAACGIRCRIGFYLTGDSIRLCGKDGSWSGNEPKCLLKTCLALRAPAHSRMRCQNEEDQHSITDNSTSYPIDTRCQFKCETGYQLRGSKVRNCLPLSQWDGLKATCKAITCEPLKQVANGQILPEYCSGPEKVAFATNCTITCKKGFALEGPRARHCGRRSGIWSQRRSVSRCIDKTPPTIVCPSDIIVKSLPGENYAYVNWTVPIATDNSDGRLTIWSKPYIIFPWKVKIGTRVVVYIAEDSTGNKARCKFKVKVIDKEPPMIENCIDPPVLYTDNGIGITNISWEEPGFHDNSKTPVQVEQNYLPGENSFPIGLTRIAYNAIDKYDNKAVCLLNITIKDICQDIPMVLNGYTNCSTSTVNKSNECTVTCKNGYNFATDIPNLNPIRDELLINCDESNVNWTDNNYIPDCSESTVPKTVSQEGSIVLEANSSICDNRTTLRELSEYITADLRSTLLDICGNNIDCDLITFDPECEENVPSSDIVYSNLIRKRREFDYFSDGDLLINDKRIIDDIDNKTKRNAKMNMNPDKSKKKLKKKEKIEMKFKFIGKIIDENIENPREGVQKLREKLESMSRSGKLDLLNSKTNEEIARLALNLHLVFNNFHEICDPGSVLKKHSCVKCPRGTFFNSSTKRCIPCPFGEYEDASGSLNCKRCPEHTYTRRMHAKSLHDCIEMCKPGYYSRKKRYHDSRLALEPCLACNVGFYQPEYGQNHCLSCPYNTTTRNRGSKEANDCLLPNRIDFCHSNPCLNSGQCVQELDSFSCNCPDYYVGSTCETFRNPCDSSPCLNEGICNVKTLANSTISHTCTCKNGYSGLNCEIYIDECTVNPCKNNGTCVSTEDDYACQCKSGFEGEFCEIAVDHCDPFPCEEGSTCRTVNETWQCFCKAGFLGRHCNLLPCDWLPCHGNSFCVNIQEINATKLSYRCECIEGYTGENCTLEIDHCNSVPCLNNGQCVNGIYNYTCVCSVPYTGRNCETELSSDYVMHFVKSGTTDYARTKGPSINLLELTACLWLQSKDTFNYGTVLSYATRYYDNAFTITDYNGVVIYVNGQKVVTDIKVNDGHWHFVCVTWKSENGTWNIFIDGALRDSGIHFARESSIQGNGTLVVGQEQDRLGGGFSESESFLGKVTLLDIWSSVLTEADVKHLFNTCEKYYGDAIAWPWLQEHVHGDVVILSSPFCRGCPLPAVPFKGNINVSKDLSEITYACDTGYNIRFHGREYETLKLKCLKQGQWEGYYTPVCARRKCGFPDYFPRGRIRGRSYLFQDEIHYSCLSGYQLRGNPRRVCNASGKWSGLPPVCIGKTCRNLLAPENGDIEYVIEEYERDDLSILQAGQQLEFKCNLGYRLVGEKFLTCLESGIWDYERPICVAFGCPPPKQIRHGYMIAASSNNSHEPSATTSDLQTINNTFNTNYYLGDIVGYSCHRGYKFQANHNLLTEFRLQCSENNTWIGFVPDCEPLKCSWPSVVSGGMIFLKTQNNDSIELFRRKIATNMTEIKQALENQFILDSQIILKCDVGYKLTGNNVSICTSNEDWLPKLSSCEPRECPISNHPLWKLFNIRKNLSDENLETVEYYNGTYKNLHYFVEGNTYSKKIIFTCNNNAGIKLNEGNESFPNITWRCNETSHWDILNFKLNNIDTENLLENRMDSFCQVSVCALVTIPEYAYIVDDNNKYPRNVNSTIIFKCRHGYTLEGSEKSVCLPNNTWSAIPSCKPIVCGNPPVPAKAVLKEGSIGTNLTFGNMITYQCMPGYLMFGQPSTRCLANGKWSKIYSKCSKLSCNKPKLLPGVTIHGRSYLYQDQLTYICPGGKKKGTIVCKANGNWSDPPNCKEN